MENFWDNVLNFLSNQGLKIILGIAAFFVGLLLVKLAKKIIKNFLRKKKIDGSRISFTLAIIDVLLKIVVVILSLSIMNVDTTSLLAVVSTCGVAIGLALKDSLSNIASGIIIMYNSPFKEGDYVKVNQDEGNVIGINLFSTTLKTADNKKIILPNSSVLNNPLVNYNAMPTRRIDMIFTIAYGNNIENVKNIFNEIIKNNNLILNVPKYDLQIENLTTTNIEVLLKVWVKNEHYWKVYYYLNYEVYKYFNNNDVTLPINKMNVNVKKLENL